MSDDERLALFQQELKLLRDTPAESAMAILDVDDSDEARMGRELRDRIRINRETMLGDVRRELPTIIPIARKAGLSSIAPLLALDRRDQPPGPPDPALSMAERVAMEVDRYKAGPPEADVLDKAMQCVVEVRTILAMPSAGQTEQAAASEKMHSHTGFILLIDVKKLCPDLDEKQVSRVRGRLKHWRKKHEDEVKQIGEAGERPRYLYPESIVLQIAEKIRAG